MSMIYSADREWCVSWAEYSGEALKNVELDVRLSKRTLLWGIPHTHEPHESSLEAHDDDLCVVRSLAALLGDREEYVRGQFEEVAGTLEGGVGASARLT